MLMFTLSHKISVCSELLPVDVSFEQGSYTFGEGDGELLEDALCVVANYSSTGRTNSPVRVTVRTTAITAQGWNFL